MALGVVGGLTKLHPLAALSMEILGNPSAEYLMMVAAAAGLANNFSAVRSLVTHGIQKGHMKMHLNNIVSGISASEVEKQKILEYFADKTVSFHSVELYLNNLRSKA
jgi:hydroxymethylglutaryl-CoA reductase